MSYLVDIIPYENSLQNIIEDFSPRRKRSTKQMVSGISGSEFPLILAGLFRAYGRPITLITYDNYRAESLYSDLVTLLDKEQVYIYPEHQVYPFELAWQSRDVNNERAQVLQAMLSKKSAVYIFSLKSAKEKLSPAQVVKQTFLNLEVGNEKLSPTMIAEKLTGLGYENTSMVEQKGQFSHRGGIIDVFPVASELPVRIEFFDDEIESIRAFDLATQRSLKEYNSLVVGPGSQLVIGDNTNLSQALNQLTREFELQKGKLMKDGITDRSEELEERINRDLSSLENGISLPHFHRYLSYFYPKNYGTIIDFLPTNSLFWVDEPNRIKESDEFYNNEITELAESLIEEGKILPGESNLFYSIEDVLSGNPFDTIYSANFLRQNPFENVSQATNMSVKSMNQFYGQWDFFLKEMKQWMNNNYRIILFSPTPESARTLYENLKKEEIGATIVEKGNTKTENQVVIAVGDLKSGFILQESKLAVITYGDLWGHQKKKIRSRKRDKSEDKAVKVSDYRELQVEDYVVHEKHGIGKYMGIKTLEVGGLYKDYLHIKYAGNDSLYVPTEQIDEIQKYVGKEGKPPKLYSLGSSEWQKVKQRVKSSVKELAEDLLKLYAERSSRKGYAFSQDTPWQKEFEDYFPYELTPDQKKAISEIKEDLESEQPMDRLLCGDVGYGKTEVAMRAAFKAVMEGKQVCVLVPTTILAQQHFQTFKERFAPYPVDIRVISRFSSQKDEKLVKEEMKEGNAEIIIGTHKLLNKSVKFRDLGLLIIDEEQRFGVQHKEKIKMLKKNLDVLTMTATPIPRTLHMSLVGVRDLSVIETPPEGRFPVQTYVMEHSPQLIREAVNREISREGQVYVVHNRVKGINKVAKEVADWVPDAKVGVAHGQMPEKQLERVMLDFYEGKYDVLVSTSIVEAGLDIQNVNTIIIYNADRMGLSQPYQLRGRVGRSNRMAYAYLTYQKDKVLTQEAEKRLKAIKEFTELGSGFKLALRDLEIRGAGNILGPEQHGHIMAVGFDMYTKMLKDAIKEISQESQTQEETTKIQDDKTEVEKPEEVKVELNINAYLPTTYISDHEQKITIYKKARSINSYSEANDLETELKDRFGSLPQEVKNLLDITRLKVLARETGIISITRQGYWVHLDLDPRQKISGENLIKLTTKFPGKITVSSQTDGLTLKVNVKNLKDSGLMDMINKVAESLLELVA
ncbi:transcription-repair coupling factor [Natranaerobius thermophilus]|uniref:Transcription-repair-coupling factor n=1 Tax=Natranaerobius thermophilus (strain ATCC BAA-1301 / DSM 18059 / JW/NM-WN-LF) TaxID=457570 RepID=B2A3P0_NATTJ|nr:transcription-repair coupling factor [Natranaerobius thermophilus]ACB83666.1 transcription-repair coupling factor [Natranaerobius thermophilus JW/NM-WN-LF]